MSKIAQTLKGKVEGAGQDGLIAFKGIPFAAPPLGELRWAPPENPEAWSGVRQASEFGAAAHQNPIPLDILPAFTIGERMDEDCLYLNVWTPGLDGAARPVMVWIHGGAFVLGSGAQSIYDGATLANRGDVVVVTINYRLGPLGFLNLSEATGGRIPSTGNEGLLDQIKGLEWVRDNIAAFGGDAGNVTIFGESAGGMSVGCLMALPQARGLFHKAIPQSGACHTAQPLERSQEVTRRVLDKLGVEGGDVAALRAVTPEQFLRVQAALSVPGVEDSAIGTMPFQPCVDGTILKQLPIESVRAGSAAGVPVLVGSTRDEWKLFGAADPSVFALDAEGAVARIGSKLGAAQAKDLFQVYRDAREARGEVATPTEVWFAIETDRVFRIPALRLNEAQRSNGSPAFSYLFTWASPSLGGLLGSCHALELGFVFGTIDSSGARDFSGGGPAADLLQRRIQDAWLAFARSGDPSSADLSWPAYTEQRETMVLGDPVALENAPRDAETRAWEGIESLGTL